MDIKKKIQDWLNGPQDYDEGMKLLQEVSKKKKVISKLFKGESKTRREKLAYLLSKEIGLREIPKPSLKKVSNKKTTEKKGSAKKTKDRSRFNLIGKDETIDDYPEEIKRVINEYSSLYMQRGKNHKKLTGLGDSNDAETVEKRQQLAEKIKAQSERMELLYEAFEGYKKSGVILTNTLYPSVNEQGSDDEKHQDHESIEDFKKLKKNLQASLAKDRNMLKFQSKTKPEDGKEAPMPEGPKRIKLEKRIKVKEAEELALDTKIAKLG
jgi:hypothetical protein